jgi:hypothetical protein
MDGRPPPENGDGPLAPHRGASGPTNQIKRNPNKSRITKSENVLSRVRRLRLSKDFLRDLEGGSVIPSGVVLDKIINGQPPYWFVTLLKINKADLLRKHFGQILAALVTALAALWPSGGCSSFGGDEPRPRGSRGDR